MSIGVSQPTAMSVASARICVLRIVLPRQNQTGGDDNSAESENFSFQ